MLSGAITLWIEITVESALKVMAVRYTVSPLTASVAVKIVKLTSEVECDQPKLGGMGIRISVTVKEGSRRYVACNVNVLPWFVVSGVIVAVPEPSPVVFERSELIHAMFVAVLPLPGDCVAVLNVQLVVTVSSGVVSSLK